MPGNDTTKGFRFAPLTRVSTGKQEKATFVKSQRADITTYVEALGGVIPKAC